MSNSDSRPDLHISPTELVERIRNRDESVYDDITDLIKDDLPNWAKRFGCPDRVEDLLCDILSDVYSKINQYRLDGDLKGWLRSLARSAARRQKSPVPTVGDLEISSETEVTKIDEENSPSEELTERQEALLDIIERRNERDRAFIRRQQLGQRGYAKDLAKEFGMTEAAVRNRCSLIKREIKEELEQLGYGEPQTLDFKRVTKQLADEIRNLGDSSSRIIKLTNTQIKKICEQAKRSAKTTTETTLSPLADDTGCSTFCIKF